MNIRWTVEVTDTFAGETNYAWARRYSFNAPDNASDAANPGHEWRVEVAP